MTEKSSGGDPTKLGRWTLVRIGAKDDITTVFVSAHHPCKSVEQLNTEEEDIEVPDVHALFIRDFCKFFESFEMKEIMQYLVWTQTTTLETVQLQWLY